MTLDSVQIRRIAFIKFLYKTGIECLRKPSPQAGASLLLFHDAAELFLGLAAEVWDARLQASAPFDAYWKELDVKLHPKNVTRKEGMLNLNKARVALKHHGIIPDRLSLETFAGTIEAFFQENTPALFGASFNEVSMADLVFPEAARDEIRKAQALQVTTDLTAAVQCAATAFDMIVHDYEKRKQDRFGRSPFFLGERLPTMTGRSLINQSLGTSGGSVRGREGGSRLDLAKVTKFADAITTTVRDLQAALKIMALGLDFRKYSRFSYLTPRVHRMQDGTYRVQQIQQSPLVTLSWEECEFCIDFVIESSLTLQEFDYTRIPDSRPLPEVRP